MLVCLAWLGCIGLAAAYLTGDRGWAGLALYVVIGGWLVVTTRPEKRP